MINIVTLVGRVGVEPEIKATTNGLEFCNFSLATNKKIKKNEQREDKTTWHKVTTFDPNLVKTLQSYVKKGSMLYLEGEIDVSEWTDKDGNKRYNTSIMLPRVTGVLRMLDSKPKSDTSVASTPSKSDDDGADIPF